MNNNTPVAYLTGSARGIGRACAAFLKSRGYRAVIVDYERESLERTREEIDADLALLVDLREEAQVKESIRRTVGEFSRIER